MFPRDPGSQVYRDNIHLQEIEINNGGDPSNWIIVSARLAMDAREAASKDDVNLTIDYGLLHDTLANTVDPSPVPFGQIGSVLSEAAFSAFPSLPSLQLEVRLDGAHTLGYRADYHSSPRGVDQEELFVRDLKTQALIGVYDWERRI